MKFQKLLLSLIVLFLAFASTEVMASSTLPDTVCAGSLGKAYFVTKTNGSTYTWKVMNGLGTLASGQGTESITVNWGATSGVDSIMVVETSAAGCSGDTEYLPVYIEALPTATISGNDSICYNFTSGITINLTGRAPWSITYSDGTTSTTVNNILTSPYTFTTPKLASSKTYTVTAVSNAHGCVGTTSGSAVIVVRSKPVTTKIRHN
jgi:hypothetical protein